VLENAISQRFTFKSEKVARKIIKGIALDGFCFIQKDLYVGKTMMSAR